MHFSRKSRLSRLILSLAASTSMGISSVMAAEPYTVINNNDSGPGSFREALASGANLIVFAPQVEDIVIQDTLVYDNTTPLRIVGRGQSIISAPTEDDFDLFYVANGADLNMFNLNFYGIGGFNLDSPGDGKGIYVKVPEDRNGIVKVTLTTIGVSDVANHGIHVSDCSLGDDCGSGSGGGGDGSAASVSLDLKNVDVWNVGHGKFDADGARVDERGTGDIIFSSRGSYFGNVGADGAELDEGDDGDVRVDVVNNQFENNGGYCIGAPLVLDHPCVEDDDGELVYDLDDAFDVDEAGAGNLIGRVNGIFMYGNQDEGLDFDEEQDGDVLVEFINVKGVYNTGEAIKVSAADEGNVNVDIVNSTLLYNGDDGAQIENENGDGETHVRVFNTISKGNDKKGIKVTQENEESPGTFKARGNNDLESVDLENIDEI